MTGKPDQRDFQKLAAQLMGDGSPEASRALVDALTSGDVASIFENLSSSPEPSLLPAPDEVRGFRVRLDLHGAKPPVWRRLELPGDLSLPQVHDVIQAAMGWTDTHLHRFRTGSDHRSAYFITEFDLDEGEDGMLENDVRLDQLVAEKGDQLWYEYDFGDGWDHTLLVEEVLPEAPSRPVCVTGRMACPPEDCGGIWGYAELAAWVRSGYDDSLLPQGFDDADAGRRWLHDWDPDEFDVEQVNEALAVAVAEPVAVVEELAHLVDQMERSGSRLLREVLGRPFAHGPTDVNDVEAARLTETYRIFLDVIGDGVDLTDAGYLRPKVVEEVAGRTGIASWWFGRGFREDSTPPVAAIRSTARALGLVSVRKGRLQPTAAARRCGEEPQALWRHIVSRLPLGTKKDERQAGWMALATAASGTAIEAWDDEIRDLLFALGWRSGYDGHSMPPSVSDTRDVLRILAGSARVKYSEVRGVDLAVAATAGAVIRHQGD